MYVALAVAVAVTSSVFQRESRIFEDINWKKKGKAVVWGLGRRVGENEEVEYRCPSRLLQH